MSVSAPCRAPPICRTWHDSASDTTQAQSKRWQLGQLYRCCCMYARAYTNANTLKYCHLHHSCSALPDGALLSNLADFPSSSIMQHVMPISRSQVHKWLMLQMCLAQQGMQDLLLSADRPFSMQRYFANVCWSRTAVRCKHEHVLTR